MNTQQSEYTTTRQGWVLIIDKVMIPNQPENDNEFNESEANNNNEVE